MSTSAAWPEEVDAVVGGDLVAVLSYVTPAGGCVMLPVSPCGTRDANAGTVYFSTSLGYDRKLERIRRDPHVSLLFHTREHGFADGPQWVLLQGLASFPDRPEMSAPMKAFFEGSLKFLGSPHSGRFWNWAQREYLWERVLVTIDVERAVVWPDGDLAVEPKVFGAARVEGDPLPQPPPARGTGSRTNPGRLAERAARLPHRLIAWKGTDGYPELLPVVLGADGHDGLTVHTPAALPRGGRRAGLLAHGFGPRVVGQEVRTGTGWLDVGDGGARFFPHTLVGYRASRNAALMSLVAGLTAKAGYRRARRQGRVVDGAWVG